MNAQRRLPEGIPPHYIVFVDKDGEGTLAAKNTVKGFLFGCIVPHRPTWYTNGQALRLDLLDSDRHFYPDSAIFIKHSTTPNLALKHKWSGDGRVVPLPFRPLFARERPLKNFNSFGNGPVNYLVFARDTCRGEELSLDFDKEELAPWAFLQSDPRLSPTGHSTNIDAANTDATKKNTAKDGHDLLKARGDKSAKNTIQHKEKPSENIPEVYQRLWAEKKAQGEDANDEQLKVILEKMHADARQHLDENGSVHTVAGPSGTQPVPRRVVTEPDNVDDDEVGQDDDFRFYDSLLADNEIRLGNSNYTSSSYSSGPSQWRAAAQPQPQPQPRQQPPAATGSNRMGNFAHSNHLNFGGLIPSQVGPIGPAGPPGVFIPTPSSRAPANAPTGPRSSATVWRQGSNPGPRSSRAIPIVNPADVQRRAETNGHRQFRGNARRFESRAAMSNNWRSGNGDNDIATIDNAKLCVVKNNICITG
ncbi:hypothetical protein EG329_006129 [Mollisiaceae sp. DMI_Dod_QoI]|nr:hypothetical protein EG329_006129 [Helotiales sp. DMI_Dod_QoI]